MPHIDQHFASQLRELKDRLVAMGGRCEHLMSGALSAIESGDVELADEVMARDAAIDADEVALDALAVRILARRQPMGRDLRLIVATLKVVRHLEQIGDEAVNLAERTARLSAGRPGLNHALALLPDMGARCARMLSGSLDAFVGADEARAHQVLEMDDDVDALYEEALRRGVAFMRAHPQLAEAGMAYTSGAKYLERIADLCTNIAEMVVFMVEGVDVRHGAFRADGAEPSRSRGASPPSSSPRTSEKPRIALRANDFASFPQE